STLLEPARQRRLHFLVEVTTVFALQYPVIFIREDDKTARDPLALKRGPVLDCVVHWHAEITLAYGHEHWCLEARRIADRVLLAPHGTLFPRWAAIHDFAAIDGIARAVLRLQVDQPGVA